jgi:hypothetical protein
MSNDGNTRMLSLTQVDSPMVETDQVTAQDSTVKGLWKSSQGPCKGHPNQDCQKDGEGREGWIGLFGTFDWRHKVQNRNAKMHNGLRALKHTMFRKAERAQEGSSKVRG